MSLLLLTVTKQIKWFALYFIIEDNPNICRKNKKIKKKNDGHVDVLI